MSQMQPRRESTDLLALPDAIDRLFRESFVRPFSGFLPTMTRTGMAVDVYDMGDHIMVEATLPGVKAEDVDIKVMGDMLTIKAETKMEKDVSEDKYSYKERSYGVWQRSIMLPASVNIDKAEAKLESGVLKLTLPKSEQERTQSIKVKGGE
jgi:HSP20 family protein